MWVRIETGQVFMKQYLNILQDILDNGIKKEDRTGTGTLSIFGTQSRYDLSQGFPLLTTKKMFLRGIIEELLWFIKGDTNIKYLLDRNVNIWNANAYDFFKRNHPDTTLTMEEFLEKVKEGVGGDLGLVYGHQWRNWNGKIDQLKNVVEEIKKNPGSRRLIVSSWNASDIPDSALPPCHTLFQFYTRGNKLDLQLYQRSGDTLLGEIAEYKVYLIWGTTY